MSELLNTLMWYGGLLLVSTLLAVLGWRLGGIAKMKKEDKKLEKK